MSTLHDFEWGLGTSSRLFAFMVKLEQVDVKLLSSPHRIEFSGVSCACDLLGMLFQKNFIYGRPGEFGQSMQLIFIFIDF